MSFPKYDRYKESGVEWLGEVPEHWEMKRLKYLGEALIGLTYDPNDVVSQDEGVLVLRSSNVQGGQIVLEDNVFVNKEIPERLRTKVSDILICSRNGSRALIGKNAKIDESASGATFGAFMTIFRSTCNDYLFYIFNSALFDYQSGAFLTSTINQLTVGTLNCFEVPIPPLPEQRSIATFLDRETAKIDELITEQQRLIDLLKEKRQAVISHAVTKGLNPDAPMKETAIEWLGEVPEHWEVSCLKRLWSITDCKHLTAEFVEVGIPLASIREVQSWYVDLSESKQTTEYFYQQLIEGGRKPLVGDLIFSRNATVGEVAQVTEDHPDFAMGQDVCLIRKNSADISSDFLQFQIKSHIVQIQLSKIMVGSTFKRINVEEIRNLIVPSPTAVEQHEIANFLTKKSREFDELIAEAQHAIALLQERRTALISAAVTGKIDVRNLVAPHP
jgi:type I restriction enzyme, S subunit